MGKRNAERTNSRSSPRTRPLISSTSSTQLYLPPAGHGGADSILRSLSHDLLRDCHDSATSLATSAFPVAQLSAGSYRTHATSLSTTPRQARTARIETRRDLPGRWPDAPRHNRPKPKGTVRE